MVFNNNDSVEISKKGLSGIYYEAVIVDAVGTNKYLVFYDTHLTKNGWFPVETVDSDEVRPSPPQSIYSNNNFFESARIDAFVGRAWRVGTVTRKFDSHCYVKLDCNELEMHCELYKLRPHLEWQNEGWIYHGTGKQANTLAQSDQLANDEIKPSKHINARGSVCK